MDEQIAPFVFGRLSSELNFTDREKETTQLGINFSSLINTILISPRRWGKSSLVKHAAICAMKNDKKLKCVFVDLFNVRTEEEFYRNLAQAVLKATSSKSGELLRKAGKYFHHFVHHIQNKIQLEV